MDPSEFQSQVRNGKLGGQVFLFAGKETFLKERALETVKARFVPPEEQGESYSVIDFSFREAGEFAGQLHSFSFSAGTRVFALYRFEDLGAADRKQIYAVLKQALPEDVLVFVLSDETAIASEATRSLGEVAQRLDFWPPFENQLPVWIRSEAVDCGVQISPEAIQALLDRVGNDLRPLSQEIHKLALRVGNGGRIGVAEVEAGVRYIRQDSVFDWIDAIGRKDLRRSLRIMEGLLTQGEAIQRLWFQLVNTLRDYRLVLDLAIDRADLMQPLLVRWQSLKRLDGKTDFKANQERKKILEEMRPAIEQMPEPLSAALNLRAPHQLRNLSWAPGFSRDQLVSLWPRLEEIDEALKSSIPNPELVLQRFLIQLLK